MKKLTIFLASTAAALTLAGTVANAGRATDGDLKILFWQAVSTLNPYLSGGTKEIYSASLTIEPLARYDQTGTLQPWLVTEIPTVDNGGVTKDMTSITWKLKPDVKWSDGTAFTAEDVIFTWQYCTAPDGGCAQKAQFEGIKSVEAPDAHTVKVTSPSRNTTPTAPSSAPSSRSSRRRNSRIASVPRLRAAPRPTLAPSAPAHSSSRNSSRTTW